MGPSDPIFWQIKIIIILISHISIFHFSIFHCCFFCFVFVFSIFHNIVIIYNTTNWSNDTTESQEKKGLFQRSCWRKLRIDCPMYSKQTNKMWSLKSLVMLKCETRTSLYAVQYKRQPGSVLMFCHYFRNGLPRNFVLMFCGTANLTLFLIYS